MKVQPPKYKLYYSIPVNSYPNFFESVLLQSDSVCLSLMLISRRHHNHLLWYIFKIQGSFLSFQQA